ncbi:MAG: hypothetical protein ACYC1E_15440 [Propionibacteriaceae bacterium]
MKVQGFYLDFTWGDGKRGSTMPDDTASRPVRPGALAVTEGLAVDGLRVVVLTVSYVFCLVGALAAFGVIPDPAPNLSSVLTAEASLLGTAPEAERLWWVALAGLGCYVVWMWFRPGVNERRARAIAYPAAATLALLGTWFFVVRADLTLGAVVALAVVAALIVTLHVADRVAIDRFFGRQLTQLGAAVTLGWMSVLAAETVAAALAARHVRPPYLSSETWGILAATALMAYGMAIIRYLPGRLYIAAAMAWGFVWLAYARLLEVPRSYGLAVVALVSALLVLVAGVAVFLWARGRVRERVA